MKPIIGWTGTGATRSPTSAVKTTSVMYYAELDALDEETGVALRAEEVEEANEQIMSRMVKSVSYREAANVDALAAELENRMSTTFFYGNKGDEIADWKRD